MPILMKFNISQPPRRNNMTGQLGYKTQKLHPRADQSGQSGLVSY